MAVNTFATTGTPVSPLDESHLQALNSVLEMESIQQEHLAACATCGLGVDRLKADSDRRLALAMALKKQFFPQSA
jgi:hypothetical protein